MSVELSQARPAAANLWKLMQEVETLRYRAERLEEKAKEACPPVGGLLLDLAAELRERAERRYALSA